MTAALELLAQHARENARVRWSPRANLAPLRAGASLRMHGADRASRWSGGEMEFAWTKFHWRPTKPNPGVYSLRTDGVLVKGGGCAVLEWDSLKTAMGLSASAWSWEPNSAPSQLLSSYFGTLQKDFNRICWEGRSFTDSVAWRIGGVWSLFFIYYSYYCNRTARAVSPWIIE